jgi:predicted ester cyclase
MGGVGTADSLIAEPGALACTHTHTHTHTHTILHLSPTGIRAWGASL